MSNKESIWIKLFWFVLALTLLVGILWFWLGKYDITPMKDEPKKEMEAPVPGWIDDGGKG